MAKKSNKIVQVIDGARYAWFQIDNCVFTAPRYLTDYLDNIIGPDEHRDYVWVNKLSPHLYATRWRPDHLFVFMKVGDTDYLNHLMKLNKIGNIVKESDGSFLTFAKEDIDKIAESPYFPELIGKSVKITHGPLEDFYGKVVKYSNDLKKYILSVKLLVSEVQIPHHLNEFEVTDKDVDNIEEFTKSLEND